MFDTMVAWMSEGVDVFRESDIFFVWCASIPGEVCILGVCGCSLCLDTYEVSSKTNATDLLKTKRFKLESYFLQHKVSLIFR
jgi:hypothetical protein